MKIKLLILTIISFFFLLFYLEYNSSKVDDITNRWYTKEQVVFGEKVFSQNCASCHGYKAEKTIEWKKTLPDGSYPPPPLNDKAHAWHHPKWQLLEIISKGGALYDGKMPAFEDKLSKEEKEAAIAYFQSFWEDKYYNLWLEYGGLKDK
ncbi:c-type cytochrome [Arcobacter sp. YIC-464]|uniref:c-type cytochrome n=1 Tax=Arcobacter sp. YIC-464 TaxID=3376631 RepID=UPI003C249328